MCSAHITCKTRSAQAIEPRCITYPRKLRKIYPDAEPRDENDTLRICLVGIKVVIMRAQKLTPTSVRLGMLHLNGRQRGVDACCDGTDEALLAVRVYK